MTVCSHVRLTDMSIFRHVYCCTAALILLSVRNEWDLVTWLAPRRDDEPASPREHELQVPPAER